MPLQVTLANFAFNSRHSNVQVRPLMQFFHSFKYPLGPFAEDFAGPRYPTFLFFRVFPASPQDLINFGFRLLNAPRLLIKQEYKSY